MADHNNRLLVVDDEKEIVQAYVDFLMPAATTQRRSSRSASPDSGAAAQGVQQGSQQGARAEYELIRAYSGDEALAAVKKLSEAGQRLAGGFFDVKMEGG